MNPTEENQLIAELTSALKRVMARLESADIDENPRFIAAHALPYAKEAIERAESVLNVMSTEIA